MDDIRKQKGSPGSCSICVTNKTEGMIVRRQKKKRDRSLCKQKIGGVEQKTKKVNV